MGEWHRKQVLTQYRGIEYPAQRVLLSHSDVHPSPPLQNIPQRDKSGERAGHGRVVLKVHYGVKGSARKGRLDLRFASARCLEIVSGTIAMPTSARIVGQVTVGSTSACRTILSPHGLPGRCRPGFPRVGTFSCPLLPPIFNGTLRTIHLASNTARRPASSFHPDDKASLKLA
ncbi:uncharacterized protein TNCV_4519741 [Trichonephila clavipes]|nr:uncharacterized protein TNCV_4519741 [Trichonephila clavipes]